MTFKLGDKIWVEGDWNFPNTCTGIISEPPEGVVDLVADSEPWSGIYRLVEGRENLLKYYWIKFDKPQYDSDKDGPYSEGEVEDIYIKLQ